MYNDENRTYRMYRRKKAAEKVKNFFSQNSIKTRNCHEVSPGLHLYLSGKSVKNEKSYDFVTFCNFFRAKLPKNLRILVGFQIRKFIKNLCKPLCRQELQKIDKILNL